METLAFYVYPLPYGTKYGKKELSDRAKVLEIFDYCQILLGVIYKNGWDFLVHHYGYPELFLISKESGWLDCSTLEELIAQVEHEKDIVPG